MHLSDEPKLTGAWRGSPNSTFSLLLRFSWTKIVRSKNASPNWGLTVSCQVSSESARPLQNCHSYTFDGLMYTFR
jgi:hypothetical protein